MVQTRSGRIANRKRGGRRTSPPATEGPPVREFTAEITFNGLVVLQILEAKGQKFLRSQGPRHADTIKVLFVETHGEGHQHGHDYGHAHRHYPRLTYYADDHLGLLPRSNRWPLNYDYLPSPEGRQTVSVDLTDKHVEIIPSYNYQKERFDLRWCEPPPTNRDPTSLKPGDDLCLDWVLSADQIGLTKTKATRAVTVIDVPPGHWRTHGIYRNREVRDLAPIRWTVGSDVQAMGLDLVLELEGLWYGLTLRISNRDLANPDPYDIVLTPGMAVQPGLETNQGVCRNGGDKKSNGDEPSDDRLKLALTNLPGSYSHADVSHVTMYAHLSGQRGKVGSPVQTDDVICAQAACNTVRQDQSGGT